MTVIELLTKVDPLISEAMKIELRAQGHYNTGALDNSIEGEIKGKHLEGTANYYAAILHHGYGPERASMRQWPFLKRYFITKGHDDYEAGRIAAMTIRAWQREGMPTRGSYAYSETGQRKNFIAIVKKAISGKIDTFVTNGIDKIVNDKFHETKSEVI